MQTLHTSGIKSAVTFDWSGNCALLIGDANEGFLATKMFNRTHLDTTAAHWLLQQAIAHYPESELARTYAGVTTAPV